MITIKFVTDRHTPILELESLAAYGMPASVEAISAAIQERLARFIGAANVTPAAMARMQVEAMAALDELMPGGYPRPVVRVMPTPDPARVSLTIEMQLFRPRLDVHLVL